MFKELFKQFKKAEVSKADKATQDLEVAFDKIKIEYAKISTSDVYQLISEYYLTKIDLNRDTIESKNPLSEEGKIRIVELQAENRVMRSFIQDMEDMKKELQGQNQTEAII
jgi:hypothetical protein